MQQISWRGGVIFVLVVVLFWGILLTFMRTSSRRLRDAAASGDVERIAAYPKGHVVAETDEDGRTLLHIAADKGRREVVEYIVERCTEEAQSQYPLKDKSYLNTEDRHGDTALSAAINRGHYDIAVYLLEHGPVSSGRNAERRSGTWSGTTSKNGSFEIQLDPTTGVCSGFLDLTIQPTEDDPSLPAGEGWRLSWREGRFGVGRDIIIGLVVRPVEIQRWGWRGYSVPSGPIVEGRTQFSGEFKGDAFASGTLLVSIEGCLPIDDYWMATIETD